MDFVRTHAIPTRFDDAVRTALEGTTRTIDVGRVSYREWSGAENERYVANVGSVGMSAAVAQRANAMTKALGGRATFFYALVRVFFEWQNSSVVVTLDDGVRREAPMHDVIVANGQWHGGAMRLAPAADAARVARPAAPRELRDSVAGRRQRRRTPCLGDGVPRARGVVLRPAAPAVVARGVARRRGGRGPVQGGRLAAAPLRRRAPR